MPTISQDVDLTFFSVTLGTGHVLREYDQNYMRPKPDSINFKMTWIFLKREYSEQLGQTRSNQDIYSKLSQNSDILLVLFSYDVWTMIAKKIV